MIPGCASLGGLNISFAAALSPPLHGTGIFAARHDAHHRMDAAQELLPYRILHTYNSNILIDVLENLSISFRCVSINTLVYH